jgi:hypothetical protein
MVGCIFEALAVGLSHFGDVGWLNTGEKKMPRNLVWLVPSGSVFSCSASENSTDTTNKITNS